MEQVNTDGEKRFYAFDNIRYFIVLLVVVIHAAAAHSSYTSWWWPVGDHNTITANYIMSILDLFIMPTMFFISGYVVLISIRNKTLAQFLIHKFIRLVIPWIFLVTIMGGINKYFYNLSRGYNVDFLIHIKTHIISFFTFKSGQVGHEVSFNQMHLWYISLLFAMLIIFGLCYEIMRRFFVSKEASEENEKSVKYMLGVFFLVAVITAICTSMLYINFITYSGREPWIIFKSLLQIQISRVAIYIFCFLLGVYAFNKKWFINTRIPFNSIYWAVLTVSLIVGFIFISKINAETGFQSNLIMISSASLRVFVVFSMLLTLISIANNYWNTNSAVNAALSRNSYSIYLIHMAIVYLLQYFFLKISISPEIKIILVSILGISISYVISEYFLRRVFRFL